MKLRNYKHYILGGLLAGGLLNFSACSLDYDPLASYSDVTEGVQNEEGEQLEFATKADVESALQALYQLIRDRMEHWYMDQLLIGDSHSDNAYGGSTDGGVINYENNSIDANNPNIVRDWDRFMADATQATRIINNVDLVPDAAFTEAERNSIKAQAMIFRSFIWFEMTRMWGNIPLNTVLPPDITADNIEEVYPDYFPPQNTQQEAYEKIEEDLLYAVQYAPDTDPADKTLFSNDVARALLAKIYAEKPMRDYSKVIQYCDELEAHGYGLADSFSDLFGMNETVTDVKMRNTREGILEAQFPASGGNWMAWMFGRDLLDYDYSFSWAKWITPSRNLVSAFEQAGDTERYNETVVWYACDWSNYYPSDHYAFAYKCRSGASSMIYLRFADILLLKAEAYLRGDNKDLNAAADIIDRIRDRAGLAPLAASVRGNEASLWEAYKLERRLELALEGQRWYDLCRWDEVESVMNNINDEGRAANVKAYNTNSYLMPLPQTVLDSNENLVQNPGY